MLPTTKKSISNFSKSYPRGEKHLKKLFGKFNNQDTIEWFKNKGVELVSEEDGRMFQNQILPKLFTIYLFLSLKN